MSTTKILCHLEIMAFEDELLSKFKDEFILSKDKRDFILRSKELELRLSE